MLHIIFSLFYFFLMIRRPPRSTLFPYNDALPIYVDAHARSVRLPARIGQHAQLMDDAVVDVLPEQRLHLRVGLRQPRRQRSEEHTSELQSRQYLVCRLLLEKKNQAICCLVNTTQI